MWIAQYVVRQKLCSNLKVYWICTYATTLPIMTMLYNTSHRHLDNTYNAVTLDLTVFLGISTLIAVAHAGHKKSQTVYFDEGVFSACNAAILVVIYAMIPYDHLWYEETYVMQVSAVLLCIYMMLPLLASFSNLWRNLPSDGTVICVTLLTTCLNLTTVIAALVDMDKL